VGGARRARRAHVEECRVRLKAGLERRPLLLVEETGKHEHHHHELHDGLHEQHRHLVEPAQRGDVGARLEEREHAQVAEARRDEVVPRLAHCVRDRERRERRRDEVDGRLGREQPSRRAMARAK